MLTFNLIFNQKMRWSKTVILFYCDTLLWKNPAQSKSNAVYKGRSTFTGRSHGVPTLISSIIWTRKNNISFKSYYIQVLTRRKNTQKVYKWIFQIVITKNASITCMFIQNNSFYSLIHSSPSSILIVHKNTHSNICLKFLCDAELIMPLLFLNISSKSLKWKQHFYTDTSHPGIIYSWIWLFGGATYQGGKKEETGSGALMINLCLISPHWYGVEKLTVSGSSNLN